MADADIGADRHDTLAAAGAAEIVDLLRRSGLVAGASSEALSQLATEASVLALGPGESLIEEGSLGEEVFFLVEGELLVFTRLRGEEVALARIAEPGSHIGEQALRGEQPLPRNAGVRAIRRSVLLRFDRAAMLEALAGDTGLQERLATLGKAQIETRLKQQSTLLAALADQGTSLAALEQRDYADGDIVFRQGDPGGELYIVRRGVAAVRKTDAEGHETLVARLLEGQSFGERALLGDGRRTATITAEGPLSVMVVDRERFLDLYRKEGQVRQYFDTLERVYDLAGLGLVTQYSGRFLGKPAVNLLIRRPDGSAVVVSRLADEPIFSLRAERAPDSGARTVIHADPARLVERRLEIANGRLIGAFVTGEWDEIGLLHRLVIDRAAWSPDHDAAFVGSGLLPAALRQPLAAHVCNCMQLDESALRRAIQAGADTLPALQNATGAGAVCGGCVPKLERLVGTGSEFQPMRLTEIVVHAEDVRSFRFTPTVPGALPPARAGQHVVVRAMLDGVPVERTYTLTSAASETRYREITVRRDALGTFSSYLFTLAPGAELALSTPRGQIYFDASDKRPLICLVAGIGVTPALGVVRSFAAMGAERPVQVLHAVRTASDLTAGGEFASLAGAKAWFGYSPHVSDEQGRIMPADIAAMTAQPNAQYLICGPDGFQHMAAAALARVGIPAHRILIEAFGHVGARRSDDGRVPEGAMPAMVGGGLAALFALQAAVGTPWNPLAWLHQSWTASLISGAVLLAFLLLQGRLSLLRWQRRWSEAAAHRTVHQWLGVATVLLTMVHTLKFGFGLSMALTAALLLVVVTAVPLQARAGGGPAWRRDAALAGHIALSVGLIGLAVTHVITVLTY